MTLGYTLLALALYVLVAARVTRAVNYDTVLDPIRLRIAAHGSTAHRQAQELPTPEEQLHAVRRYNRWTALSDFLACPWCIGFWVSVACAPAAVAVIGWPWWTAAVLPFAASHLIGIADRLVSEDMEIVDGA